MPLGEQMVREPRAHLVAVVLIAILSHDGVVHPLSATTPAWDPGIRRPAALHEDNHEGTAEKNRARRINPVGDEASRRTSEGSAHTHSAQQEPREQTHPELAQKTTDHHVGAPGHGPFGKLLLTCVFGESHSA